MFISKQEKVGMLSRIAALETDVDFLLRKEVDRETKRSTTGWTDEARAKHSERLKKTWAAKKLAKAAA